MKPRLLLTFLLLALTGLAYGQSKFLKVMLKDIEVVGGLGGTLYFGDVGGKDSQITGAIRLLDNLDIDLWQARPMITAGILINPFQDFAFTWRLSPTFISGNDLRSNYAARGYNFKTSILETSLEAQYFFANHYTGTAPYLTGGFGAIAYSFRNNTSPNRSRWYFNNSLIFGLGTRLPSKTRYVSSIDAAFHYTATDFLDGFKTDRHTPDIFFVLSYRLYFQLYTSWYYDHRGLVR